MNVRHLRVQHCVLYLVQHVHAGIEAQLARLLHPRVDAERREGLRVRRVACWQARDRGVAETVIRKRRSVSLDSVAIGDE